MEEVENYINPAQRWYMFIVVLSSISVVGLSLDVAAGESVMFDASESHGSIVSYEWDFDIHVDADGDDIYDNDVDATGATATHAFTAVGKHEVTLTVRDSYGNEDTDIVFVNTGLPSCFIGLLVQ